MAHRHRDRVRRWAVPFAALTGAASVAAAIAVALAAGSAVDRGIEMLRRGRYADAVRSLTKAVKAAPRKKAASKKK